MKRKVQVMAKYKFAHPEREIQDYRYQGRKADISANNYEHFV